MLAIDLDARTVTVVDHNDGFTERTEAFDQLVIATGATPVRPALPGVDARGVHGIQTIDDGIDLHDARRREHRCVRSWSAAATSASRWPRR